MYHSNTAIDLMQTPIRTVSPFLMKWIMLKIDLYKVCYTDIHHYFIHACMTNTMTIIVVVRKV